jgi:hypothetical protein
MTRALKSIFILLVCIWQTPVKAADGYRFFAATAGLESRLERDQEQNIVDRSLRVWSLGLGYSDFVFFVESSSFSESSGSGALIVNRKVENQMLWTLWQGGAWNSLIPYLGGGVGQLTETIDTTLLGQTSRDKSKPQMLGGGAVGARANMPYIWLSIEARVLAAERWEPNPTFGWMGRLGFYF